MRGLSPPSFKVGGGARAPSAPPISPPMPSDVANLSINTGRQCEEGIYFLLAVGDISLPTSALDTNTAVTETSALIVDTIVTYKLPSITNIILNRCVHTIIHVFPAN